MVFILKLFMEHNTDCKIYITGTGVAYFKFVSWDRVIRLVWVIFD